MSKVLVLGFQDYKKTEDKASDSDTHFQLLCQILLVSLLEIQQALRRPGMKTYKMYVNNEFIGAAGTREIVNPATGETIAVVPEASKKDVDKAVAAARAAFDSTSW